MAIGTGNLPFPGKVYNPFDILTAEELNEDVANIESLADGSGIGDGAVTPAKLSVEAKGLAFLGETILGSNGNTITLSGISASKEILIVGAGAFTGGGVNVNVQFNGDTGNNYARRTNVNGGTDVTGTSLSSIPLSFSASASWFVEAFIDITHASEKLLIGCSTTRGTAGAGNAPERLEITGKWVNAASSITSVTLVNAGAGTYTTGSRLAVYGR